MATSDFVTQRQRAWAVSEQTRCINVVKEEGNVYVQGRLGNTLGVRVGRCALLEPR